VAARVRVLGARNAGAADPPQLARGEPLDQPGGQRGGDQAAGQQQQHQAQRHLPPAEREQEAEARPRGAPPRPPASSSTPRRSGPCRQLSETRKPRLAPRATRNTPVSAEPTTLRGSMRPEASRVGVPTGPQPPSRTAPACASSPPARVLDEVGLVYQLAGDGKHGMR